MLNTANLVTIARILITPAFLWYLFDLYEPREMIGWYLLLAFILISATDGVDGAIARRSNTVTKLGKILDPIADKVLIGGTFVVLSVIGQLPWWATIAILIREVGMTAYRLLVVKSKVIPASNTGKFKTVFQSIALGWFISPLNLMWANPSFDIGFGLIYGAVFITWWSAIKYVKAAM